LAASHANANLRITRVSCCAADAADEESNLPCSDRNGSRRKIDQSQKLCHYVRQQNIQNRMPARAGEMPAILLTMSHGEITGRWKSQLIDKVKTLLEMIRDSALWPPLNSFQRTVIEDDDEYDTPTPREHPAPLAPDRRFCYFFPRSSPVNFEHAARL
jgi:hypothetical protein